MILSSNEQEAIDALTKGVSLKKEQQHVISFDDDEPTQGNQGQVIEQKIEQTIETKEEKTTINEQSMAKASGYYNVKKQNPLKNKKQSKQSKQDNQIYFDDKEDVGEVGEWYDKTAKENQDNDDEFDVFDQPQSQGQEQPQKRDQEQDQKAIQQQREKVNQKLQQKGTTLSKRQGPIVNNLRQKAQMMALQNNTKEADTQKKKEVIQPIIHSDEEEEHPPQQEYSSPNKLIFQLQENELEQRLSEVDVWGKVNEQREFELQNKKPKEELKKIVFIDAWDELKQNTKINQEQREERGFFSKLFTCFRVDLKNIKLIDEKNLIIQLAQMQFDDQKELHFQMLYTVYCTFMNTDVCQRYGSHWENIGFQGRDPATDLRGSGMLGLLQILAFLTNYKEYIQDCLGYSKQEMVQFPLCITLINVTTFCLQSLKVIQQDQPIQNQENKLNGMINKEGSVMSVMNKIYFAGFYQFFILYKQYSKQFYQLYFYRKQCNFHSIGPLLGEIKNHIMISPNKLVADFKKAISFYYKNRNDDQD